MEQEIKNTPADRWKLARLVQRVDNLGSALFLQPDIAIKIYLL